MKHMKLVLAGLLVSSAAGAVPRAPDFVWRRGAFSQPADPSASGSGLLGITERAQCFVLRSPDSLLLKTFHDSYYSCQQAIPSSDGRLVAVFSLGRYGDAVVRVFETAGWTEVMVIASGRGYWAPVFSPDSRLLAFPSDLGMTRVYDVGSWSLRMTLSGQGPISISPDSRLIALRSDSNSIRLYRLEDGAEVTPPSGYPASNHYLLGNDWIALADNDGVRIETIAEPPQIIATLAAPRIQPLAISPDARWLAGIFDGGQAGAMLQLWDTKSFSSAAAWSIGSPFSTNARVAFTSNVSIVSVSYTTDTSQIGSWSVPDGHFLDSLNVDRGLYTLLVYSPDGSVVVGGFGPAGNIRAWRSSDGLPLQTIAGSNRVASLGFTNDGQYLVGGGERLNVWSWPDGNPLQSVSETTLEVAISSRAVVAQRTQNEIRLRSLPDLALVRTISQGGPIAFSPDGSLLAVGADLFAVETGVRVQTFGLSPFFAAAFSPDGADVILSEEPSVYERERGYLDRFDVARGDLLARFGQLTDFGGDGWANSLSFSPDGSRLAQFSVVPSYRANYIHLRIWDGYGVLYQDYDDDLGFGNLDRGIGEGPQLRYSPDGRSLAITSHQLSPRGLTSPMSAFGVALDPSVLR
jgi:WD40 repeat protein